MAASFFALISVQGGKSGVLCQYALATIHKLESYHHASCY